MHNLDKLPSEQSVKAIDDILEDIAFRKKCLLSRLGTATSLLESKPEQVKLFNNTIINSIRKLEIISVIEKELDYLRENLRAIEQYTDEYDKLLRDDQFQDIPCSKYILLLEMLRVRTEELEIFNYFPKITQLIEEWQSDHSVDNEFKPKVLDLFKSVELDVKHLLSNDNCIYLLPYKIGVIGDRNVGKSTLLMNLAEINQFSLMVDMTPSIFSYLQYDTFVYKNPDNNKIIPITFIDIEGAIDINKSQSVENYIELINKADCDLYIIVFDRSFNDHNRICQEYIEKKLGRKCLLVRSKADLLFNDVLLDLTNKKYEKRYTTKYQVKSTLNKLRRYALVTTDGGHLSNKVYLTATICNDDLKEAPFTAFDLNKLKKELLQLAIADFRVARICKLAICASRTIINTCFRRGYVVSQTRYRWLAAGASIIPFLDELPAFFGREKIRQTFGIHDNSTITNAFYRIKDSFEEYLIEKKLTVPKKYLKSGYFKYLISKNAKQTATPSDTDSNQYVKQEPTYHIQNKNPTVQNASLIAGHTGTIIGHTGIILGALGKVADDAARLIIPSSSIALRAISIAGIVVGAVLTPVFAAWTFYYTGKRMNKHLHLLCDDLVIILAHFIISICNSCRESRQLSVLTFSNEDSSFSNADFLSSVTESPSSDEE
ncbi:unnamed protein product [Rotaria sp. Silwood1]|nr:unnamed protein product [Rotaria sp. Silwood1]